MASDSTVNGRVADPSLCVEQSIDAKDLTQLKTTEKFTKKTILLIDAMHDGHVLL